MVLGSGFRNWDLRFRVWGLGFWVEGLWFIVEVLGFRVQGSGFRVKVQGLRSGVYPTASAFTSRFKRADIIARRAKCEVREQGHLL